MRVVFVTNVISPHQIPWCREFVHLVGEQHFRYVYTEKLHEDRAKMGWNEDVDGVPCIRAESEEACEWAEYAEVLIYDGRDLDLFERRAARGLKTYCASERWFKPMTLCSFRGFSFDVPGWFRLLSFRYLRMAWRFRRLLSSGDLTYLPTGVVAAADMVRLVTGCAGDPLALKNLDAATWRPLDRIKGYSWMRMWGYFVAPSDAARAKQSDVNPRRDLRVLWVGRLLAWKRVDTLFKAVAACLEKFPVKLTVVGDGPERSALEKLGRRLFSEVPSALTFMHSVPINDVRTLMQTHDVYVLPSNGYEGWGAVVNEAVEEGMTVLGTFEAGASATILRHDALFHAGDGRALVELLEKTAHGEISKVNRVDWSARNAAQRLFDEINRH